MSLDQLFEIIGYGTYIVRLKYKYDYETEYTISNEVLDFSYDMGYIWLNDWYEGQHTVEVVAFINIDDIDFREVA